MSEAVERLRPGTCPICGAPLDRLRRDATCCGSACRRKAYRRRLAASEGGRKVPAPDPKPAPHRRAERVADLHPGAEVQPRCSHLTERLATVIEGTDPDAGLIYRELAQIGYNVEEPSDTQLSAVRRSVARLVRDGRAAQGRLRDVGSGGRRPREVHRPLTPVELEAKRAGLALLERTAATANGGEAA